MVNMDMVLRTIIVLISIEISKSQETLDSCFNDINDDDCWRRNFKSTQQNQAEYIQALENEINSRSVKTDCSDFLHARQSRSGIYGIDIRYSSEPKQVFCDMETDGGGWTVIQRRQDGSVNFERTWDEYKNGFGDPAGEHWLGNKYIHALTMNGRVYDLRIDLVDWEGEERHAIYSFFRVYYERYKFQLNYYKYMEDQSNAGDSLDYHKEHPFTTLDRGNDADPSYDCASHYGGFWRNSCQHVGLNNLYSNSSDGYGYDESDRIRWDTWHGSSYSLKATKMMIRPID